MGDWTIVPRALTPSQCRTCKLMFVALEGLLIMFTYDVTTCQFLSLCISVYASACLAKKCAN